MSLNIPEHGQPIYKFDESSIVEFNYATGPNPNPDTYSGLGISLEAFLGNGLFQAEPTANPFTGQALVSIYGFASELEGLAFLRATTGTVYTEALRFIGARTGTVQTIGISYATARVAAVNEAFDLSLESTLGEFGSEGFGYLAAYSLVRDAVLGAFLYSRAEIEKTTARGYITNTMFFASETAGFMAASVTVPLTNRSFMTSSVVAAQARQSYMTAKVAQVALPNFSSLRSRVRAVEEKVSILNATMRVFDGRLDSLQATAKAVNSRLQFLRSKVNIGIETLSFVQLLNTVIVAEQKATYMQSVVKILSAPFLSNRVLRCRARVVSTPPNETVFYPQFGGTGRFFDAGVLNDPFYNEYKYGIQ